MHSRLFVPPAIRRAFRDLILSRTGSVKVMAHLHGSLPQHANLFRANRWVGRPDLFVFDVVFSDEGKMPQVVFGINDTHDPGTLEVELLMHPTGGT